MSSCRPEPYRGSDSYLFISYSHKDADRVLPELDGLARRGFRFWYDDGIQPFSDWPQEIADVLSRASAVLVFVSPAAVASDNVRNEIYFALNNKKAIFPVQLEDVVLPSGLALRMGDIQAIQKWQLQPDEYWHRLLQSLPSVLRAPFDYRPIWSSIVAGTQFSPVRGVIPHPLGREILLINSSTPDVWIHALWSKTGKVLWRVHRNDDCMFLEKVAWNFDYLYLTGSISVEADLKFIQKYWLREGDLEVSLAWYEAPPHSSQKYESVPEWDSLEWHEVSQLERIGVLNTAEQFVRLMRGGKQLEFQISGRLGTWAAAEDEITSSEILKDGTIVVALRSGRVCLLGTGE